MGSPNDKSHTCRSYTSCTPLTCRRGGPQSSICTKFLGASSAPMLWSLLDAWRNVQVRQCCAQGWQLPLQEYASLQPEVGGQGGQDNL
eukprot:1141605-Pelagomonas_calceolata.AAC.1